MADISMTISDALDTKIKARWGTTLAWKQWVKDKTKLELLNAELRQIEADMEAAREAARATVIDGSAGL